MLNYKFILVILTCSIIGVLSSGTSHAATYFEWNGESGYQYLGSLNKHPGGGYFSWLGGQVSKPEGTGCQDPQSTHNTILSGDTAAIGSILGSKNALKTPYNGACPNESFSRDNTTITTPPLYEGYMRYYQKWTGDWNSSSVQHKYTKFYGGYGTLPVVHFSFAPKAKNWRTFVPNLEKHFDKDGIARSTGSIWVNATPAAAGSAYAGVNRSYDDLLNGINGTDGEMNFETDRWYSIEYHWKVNSDAYASDGVLEAWVDGKKVFGIYDFKFFNTGTRPSVSVYELQHIYYNRSTTNQPTYIDNIIISDRYNGPVGSIKAPAAPTGVTITQN